MDRILVFIRIKISFNELGMCINNCMRIFELMKPKSPEQLRLDQLRATSKRASDAVKIERERQKAQSAQKALQKLRMPSKSNQSTVKFA
jgi:hypothetical protein